jgi:hypothetical protein
MNEVSFKERVRQTVIECSKEYKENFVKYDYLVCSAAFANKYYIISAREDNYQHLTGVHSLISAQDFFDKCYQGTLSESDFDFVKRGQSEKSVKGSVREKIAVLKDTMNLFANKDIFAEESFGKNRVFCSFATAIPSFTLGFTNNVYATPKSLLKNNKLSNSENKVDLVIRKLRSSDEYSEIVLINEDKVNIYYDDIKNVVSSEISDALLQYTLVS